MTNVGIDAIGFYTSHYYLDLNLLAKGRTQPSDHYYNSLGQYKMAVAAPGEDIITLATNAASRLLQHTDPNHITCLLFATESGVDQSKAAGIYVHHLLNLPPSCRVLELKQACYSATGALQLMLPLLA